MKIDQAPSVSTAPKFALILECEAERAIPDRDLITLMDNCVGLSYVQRRKSYRLNSKGCGEPRHFGGEVRRDGDRVSVVIFSVPQSPIVSDAGSEAVAMECAA